eukprot:35507-Pyramimonas_sp.AAC.3
MGRQVPSIRISKRPKVQIQVQVRPKRTLGLPASTSTSPLFMRFQPPGHVRIISKDYFTRAELKADPDCTRSRVVIGLRGMMRVLHLSFALPAQQTPAFGVYIWRGSHSHYRA